MTPARDERGNSARRILLVAPARLLPMNCALELEVVATMLPLGPADNAISSMRDIVEDCGRIAESAIDMILVMAECEPIRRTHCDGDLYLASDFVNLMGDNPLIGTQPDSPESFFVDMNNPFLQDTRILPTDASIHSAVLAGWSGSEALSELECARLAGLGVDIISVHGVSEAIAARALGISCMALFCAHGDTTGAAALQSCLRGLTAGSTFVIA